MNWFKGWPFSGSAQEQGSSSNSQLTYHMDWPLSRNSIVCEKMEALIGKMDYLSARSIDVRTELRHDEIQPGKKPRMEVH